jgi:hypothetical protein
LFSATVPSKTRVSDSRILAGKVDLPLDIVEVRFLNASHPCSFFIYVLEGQIEDLC